MDYIQLVQQVCPTDYMVFRMRENLKKEMMKQRKEMKEQIDEEIITKKKTRDAWKE